MNGLGHAEAHERLADLALEPGALDRMGARATDPLSAHVATCDACAAEVRAWQRTEARVWTARGSGPEQVDLGELAGDDPITAPPGVRDAVLGAVRALSAAEAAPGQHTATSARMPSPLQAARGRLPDVRRLLPLVAVLGIVAVGAGLLIEQSNRLDRATQETAALAAAATTLDRVLRDPDHRVVDLRGADGTVRGTLSWSSHDLVVLTTALEPPPPDRVYRCWIERDGVRSPVGRLRFAGETAFWNGSLDDWATISLDAGGTFGVSLEPVTAPAGNPAVLAGTLGG
jgi:hypothetical protein